MGKPTFSILPLRGKIRSRAAQLANAVADAFVVDQLDARFESAKRASGWLSDRLVELRRQLRDSEEAVAKFRKERRLTRSGPTVALNDQQLADLNSKLISARTDAAEKKARVDFLADLALVRRGWTPCRIPCCPPPASWEPCAGS